MPCHRVTHRRVDWKEQALVAQVRVELLARHSGLDDAIEILDMNVEYAIHIPEVDRHAAQGCVGAAFKRCPGAERSDRDSVARTYGGDLLDVLARLRKDHRIRRLHS